MSDYRILFALRAGNDPFSEERFDVDMFYCGLWNSDWEDHHDNKGRLKPEIKKAHHLMTGDNHPLIHWQEVTHGMTMRMRFCSDLITGLLCIQSDTPMEREDLNRVINGMDKERYHEFVKGAQLGTLPPRIRS